MVLKKDSKLKFPHLLLIDASAGSGKTHTLTQRFVQFLLSKIIDNNDLTNMLAITFTNNAAQEMKRRILLWLKKLSFGRSCPELDQTKELLSMPADRICFAARHALERLINHWSDFHVQTIDSFMNRILRASANELGMPLEVNVTESYGLFIDAALEITIKQIDHDISYREIDKFLGLLNQESEMYQWNPVVAIKKYFRRFLREEGKVVEEIIFNDFERETTGLWDQIKIIYKKIIDAGHGKTIKTKIHDYMNADSIKGVLDAVNEQGLWFDRRHKYQEAAALCPELAEMISRLAEIRSQAHYAHFMILYDRFKPVLEMTKRRNWTIHFDDINKRLSDYMNRDNIPDIYCRLGDSLYHFLIDEFQDTDRVQWENLKPLIDEAFSKGGTLFAVGDTKQAIYMFRKADYRIMRNMVMAIKDPSCYGEEAIPPTVRDNAEVVPLKENYRSGEIILQYVEQMFKEYLPKMRDQLELHEDLSGLTEYEQYTTRQNRASGYVKTTVVQKGEDNIEQNVLLDTVNDIKERFRLRDIAILARKNTQVENIVEWLTNARINAVSYSSLSIKKRKVIMEIIDLLSFLDSPIDDLSFAGFVLGNIMTKILEQKKYSVQHQAIVNFLKRRVMHRKGNLYVDFRKDPELTGLWADFFEELFNKVGFYPLYDLVVMIYRRFDIFNNFPDETGFLVKFLETIGIVESRGLNDIRSFLELVHDDEEESVLDIMLPDYIDAVKVMTFHKAKGLGFPVVINLIYDSTGKKDAMHFVKEEDALQVYSLTDSMAAKSMKLKRLREEKLLDEKIQNLNLLYVVNTRAEKELYNIVIMRDDQYHDPIYELFKDCEYGSKVPGQVRAEADRPSEIAYTVSRSIEFDAGGQREKWTARRWYETRRGEFIHSILERLVAVAGDVAGTVEEIIHETAAQSREQYDLDEIKDIVLGFIRLPQVREWFSEKENRVIQREIEYVDRNGQAYRIDRLLIDADQITIIDYKTGQEKSEAYKSQLKKYVDLVGRTLPGKKVIGYIALVERAEIVEVV